jgi:hypothetical protein
MKLEEFQECFAGPFYEFIFSTSILDMLMHQTT